VNKKHPGNPRSELKGTVAKLTAMQPGDNAQDVYEAWAPAYECELLNGYGYQAHTIAANALAARLVDQSAHIADLGCGTGLVAEALVHHGFKHIDGFDASRNMLEQARVKGVYEQLVEIDLTDLAAMPAGVYDAAIAVGVFGAGHVGPQHLACFFAPVKPGGLVALYANGIPYVEDDYPAHLAKLEADGVCTQVVAQESNYMDKIDRPGWLVLATRC
jgi:predicted TPR repeat methyltransferase